MTDLMRFDAPVGTLEERAGGKLWPGKWFDATGFNVPYPPSMHRLDFHPGADLNAPLDADAHAPVYAVANGLVVFAYSLAVWGKVVVVKHVLEDGRVIWSRYAHLHNITVPAIKLVARGEQLGTIGNAEGTQAYHLHFDMAIIDLGKRPGDWPNTDRARLVRDYVDPLKFIQARHGGALVPITPSGAQRKVTASPRLRVRATPDTGAALIGYVAEGTLVSILSEYSGWGFIEQPLKGWISLQWTAPVQPSPPQPGVSRE